MQRKFKARDLIRPAQERTGKGQGGLPLGVCQGALCQVGLEMQQWEGGPHTGSCRAWPRAERADSLQGAAGGLL